MEKKKRIALLANRSHREGPDSQLIRFVREFEDFLLTLSIRAGLGAWWSIKKCDLLSAHDDFLPLPAGLDGGLVDVAKQVVEGELDVVIYFMDPRDPTSIYPEANAVKRECVAKGKFFLSTYASAVEWASLKSASPQRTSYYMLTISEANAIKVGRKLADQQIALIAHDGRKVEMLDFALINHKKLLEKFRTRFATGTTGGYLNGEIKREKLLTQLKEKLIGAKSQGKSEKIEKDIKVMTRIVAENPQLEIQRQASGPNGGDVQIAFRTITRECDKVIFFEDPYEARAHEPDIQLLERTCRLCGEDVVCLSDPVSANLWAEAWKSGSGDYLDQPPVTVLKALEQHFSINNHKVRVVLARTVKDAPNPTMLNVCEVAAWYITSFIECLAKKTNGAQPVRIAIPWGRVASDLIEKLREVKEEINRKIQDTKERYKMTVRRPHDPRTLVAIPMIGVLAAESPLVESNTLAARLAALYPDGKTCSIPAPAYVKQEYYNPGLLGEVSEEFKKADIVILVGGPLPQNQVYIGIRERAVVWPEIIATAHSKGAIGDVCELYLSQTGEPLSVSPYQRVGFDWVELKKIAEDQERRVILLIGGRPDYLPIARTLLKANVVSTLVTDIGFARQLLDLEVSHAKES